VETGGCKGGWEVVRGAEERKEEGKGKGREEGGEGSGGWGGGGEGGGGGEEGGGREAGPNSTLKTSCKAPLTKNLVRVQNRSRGTILVAKNCPPGPEMCPLLVRLYQKWSRGYKCQAHSENAILDAMDSFSRRPDGGGLAVHDAKALHVAPRMHGGRKRSIR